MATIYWFALIVGGGMLASSFFGDLTGADIDDGGGDADAAKILSLRNLTYFLFGFGASGVALVWLGQLPAPATAGMAVGVGTLAAAAVALLLGYVRRGEAGEHQAEDSFVGCAGRITLPFAAEHAGRVVIQRGPREYELRARPFDADAADTPIGADIVVVEMDGGTALVTPLEALLPPSGMDA